MKKKASLPFRLPSDLVAPWLTRRGLVVDLIGSGRPVWKTSAGLVPLSVEDAETLISLEDPVAWALLNLAEPRDVLDAETGAVAIPRGSPWRLFPAQVRMARLASNALFECGAETGKTRNIILKSLWRASTIPGSKILVACSSQTVAEEIAVAMEYQARENPTIGGGLARKLQKAPFYALNFENGSEIQLRLVGADGSQLRGFHGTAIFGDECALWRSTKCFTELYRAAEPGAVIQLFSTHNGDRASAWYGIVSRARPIDNRAAEVFEETKAAEAEPGFVKLRIGKPDLPPPLWSPARKTEAVALYGGESASGYRQNVLGEVGDPTLSIFPASLLEPCLSRTIDRYRLVVVEVEPESGRAKLKAARLSGSKTGEGEVLLADEEVPLASDRDVADSIARFFPETSETERLYLGADLGSAKDPTEAVVARVDGSRWTDVFRLHLANASWELQTAVFVAVDCASHHRLRIGLDAGSAGAFLAQRLAGRDLEVCPLCRRDSRLSERVSAFNFGEVVDAVDVETGEPIPNPERTDAAGRPVPRRLSNKEFSTRILEAKIQKRLLVLADDEGAGDTRLGVSALLRGVSQIGVTSRGERRFSGRNDHHIDARRQLALVVAKDARDGFAGGGFVTPDPAWVVTSGGAGRASRAYLDNRAEAGLPQADAGDFFGRGSVGRSFGNDW